MLSAPQQNWPLYERRAQASNAAWLRSLTPSERFDLCAELFDIVWAGRSNPENGDTGDWDRLDDWHWREKLALRIKMVEAFRKLDQINRERGAGEQSEALPVCG